MVRQAPQTLEVHVSQWLYETRVIVGEITR